MKMLVKAKNLYLQIITALTVFCFVTVPAWAATTDVDDLFTAFDISNISSNVKTILLLIIAIMLMFVGFRYLRKTAGQAR